MTNTTEHLPPRRARKRARRSTDPRRRRVDLRRRRRRIAGRIVSAELALHHLMQDAEVYRVKGAGSYLVARLDPDTLDALIVASGSTEDEEPNSDLEWSIGPEELEPDTGDDEAALGWANEGPQYTLSSRDEEAEPELAWPNTGPQLRLAGSAHQPDTFEEGDGNADDEENGDMEPEVDDDGIDADGGTGYIPAM